MTSTGVLAAVRAAALSSVSTLPGVSGANQQESNMTNHSTTPAAPENKIGTVADLRAAYPSLVGQVESDAVASGASAERERILGIESIAVAGHEALIEGFKKDGKTSPAEAALAILGAERTVRASQMRGIESVESVTGVVQPTVSSAPRADHIKQADTPEGWKAEWEGSEALRSEFDTSEAYVSYQQGVASGRIKRLQAKSA